MARSPWSKYEAPLAHLDIEERVSPVPELLGTNTVPSSIQADAIRQFLDGVDNELQQLESILLKLAERRDSLRSSADGHRALLSPARKLYPDLLREIFAHCPKGAPTHYPDTTSINLPDNFSPHHGPLLLTQICRSWRQTAITTPNIWSTIRFVLGPRSKTDPINLWLERSANCDLTIALLEHPNPSSRAAIWGLSCNEEALGLLASQAHRWKSAFFSLCIGGPHWVALDGAKGKMERLRHLTVHPSPGLNQRIMPTLFTGLSGLTYLSLNRHVSGEGFPEDGSNIKHFRYEKHEGSHGGSFVPIGECLEITRRLPNLESCLLQCSMFTLTSITNITMVELKDLQIQMAYHPRDRKPEELWKALQLPNLSALTITSQFPSTPLDHGALASLIARCPRLTSLFLAWYSALEPEHIIEVLQQASRVSSLRLRLHEYSAEVISCIAQSTASELRPMLPSLEEIHISMMSFLRSRTSLQMNSLRPFPKWSPAGWP
ncbi:hypothetical protein H1R20_g14299, partial [Candolleomyces eurysporus]